MAEIKLLPVCSGLKRAAQREQCTKDKVFFKWVRFPIAYNTTLLKEEQHAPLNQSH
jgi:hypothetical protein